MTELNFEQREDGVYLIGEVQPAIFVADCLMRDHDQRWMQVEDDLITFTAMNGTWRYRIVLRGPEAVVAHLVTPRPTDQGGQQ